MAITLEAIKATIDADITPLEKKAKEAQSIIEKTQNAIRKTVEKTSNSFKKLSGDIKGAGGKVTGPTQQGKTGIGLAAGAGALLGSGIGASITSGILASTGAISSVARRMGYTFGNLFKQNVRRSLSKPIGIFSFIKAVDLKIAVDVSLEALNKLGNKLINISKIAERVGSQFKQVGGEIQQLGRTVTEVGTSILKYLVAPFLLLATLSLRKVFQMPQFAPLWVNFKKAIDNVLTSIGLVIMKTLPIQKILVTITNLLNKFANYIRTSGKWLVPVIAAFLFLSTLLAGFLIIGGKLITLFGTLFVILGSILIVAAKIVVVFGFIVGTIGSLIAPLIGSLISLGAFLSTPFGAALAIALAVLGTFTAIDIIVRGIRMNWGQFFNKWIGFAKEAYQFFKDAAKFAGGFVSNLAENLSILFNWIREQWDLLLMDMFLAIVRAYRFYGREILPGIFGDITEKIGNLLLEISGVKEGQWMSVPPKFNLKIPDVEAPKIEEIVPIMTSGDLPGAQIKGSLDAYSTLVKAQNRQTTILENIALNNKKIADNTLPLKALEVNQVGV